MAILEQNRWAANKDTIQLVPTKECNDEWQGVWGKASHQRVTIHLQFLVLSQFSDSNPIYWRDDQVSRILQSHSKYPWWWFLCPKGFGTIYSGKLHTEEKRIPSLLTSVKERESIDGLMMKLMNWWWNWLLKKGSQLMNWWWNLETQNMIMAPCSHWAIWKPNNKWNPDLSPGFNGSAWCADLYIGPFSIFIKYDWD